MKRKKIKLILFVISYFLIGFLFAMSPAIGSMEQEIIKKNYSEAVKKAEKILTNRKTTGMEANEAAIYIRYALLQKGTLNSEYLKYWHFLEMQEPLPDEISEGENRAYILFCQKLGFIAQTENMVSDIIKKYFIEGNDFKNIPWFIIEQCYLFLGKEEYLYMLKNNAGINTQENKQEWLNEAKTKTKASPLDTIIQFYGGLEENVSAFFPIYRQNKDLLEVYALQALMEKKLNEIPVIVERYNMLGYKKLPKYIEEASGILSGKITAKNAKTDSYAAYYFDKHK
jgi:hypothetical protein